MLSLTISEKNLNKKVHKHIIMFGFMKAIHCWIKIDVFCKTDFAINAVRKFIYGTLLAMDSYNNIFGPVIRIWQDKSVCSKNKAIFIYMVLP